jgi:hypothetical protein
MSTIFQTIASKAKAHHASVNAAYSTYYPSSSSTPSTSTTSTPRQSMDNTTSSQKSHKPNKAWSTIKKVAKEHHESLNSAYTVYYGAGSSSSSSPVSSAAGSPRGSLEATKVLAIEDAGQEKQQRRMSKAWEKVKKAAREHHEGVNAAYDTYYGAGVSRR